MATFVRRPLLLALLLALGWLPPTRAAEPLPVVGVVGPAAAVEALRDQRVPAQLLPLEGLRDAERLPALLLAQGGAVASRSGVEAVRAYLRGGGRLLLTGWGPVVGPDLRAKAPLYGIEEGLGIRVTGYSPRGSRWVQLREAALQKDPGWETIVDLGEGPSLVVELRPGAREWGRWVASGRALRGGARSAALVVHGSAAFAGRDLLREAAANPAALDLLVALVRHLDPALGPGGTGYRLQALRDLESFATSLERLRSLPRDGAGPEPHASGARPDRTHESTAGEASDLAADLRQAEEEAARLRDPRVAEIQGLWLASPDLAPAKALSGIPVNTVVLPLTDSTGAFNPRLWEDADSRRRLMEDVESVRRTGARLWVEVPVLRGGRRGTQGQWLRSHPDWADASGLRFNPALPAFRDALAEQVGLAAELLEPCGVILTDWWDTARPAESGELLERLRRLLLQRQPDLLTLALEPEALETAGPGASQAVSVATTALLFPGPRGDDEDALVRWRVEVIGLAAALSPEGLARAEAGRSRGHLGALLRPGEESGTVGTGAYPGLKRALEGLFPSRAAQPQADPLDAAGLLLAAALDRAPELRKAAREAVLDLQRLRVAPTDAALEREARSSLRDLLKRDLRGRQPASVGRDLSAALFWLQRHREPLH